MPFARRSVLVTPLVGCLALACQGTHVVAAPQVAASSAPVGDPAGPASVLEHHLHPNRDGLYTDSAFTAAAAAGLHRDPSFDAPLDGPTYAQPLYWDAAGRGPDLVIQATEQNEVAAFDARNGAAIWKVALGTPVPRDRMGCGNIDPFGITGTPVIDGKKGTLYADAVVLASGAGNARGRSEAPVRHQLFALSVADGHTLAGWPVDLSSVTAGGASIDATITGERGALALLGDSVYVPFGGLFGDCGAYHGWLVGVPTAGPGKPTAWATPARGGGVWAPSGPSSDGQGLYLTTGNTFATNSWAGGEAVIRLHPGPRFTGDDQDYFVPKDWKALDDADLDLSGTGPLLVDLPSGSPSHLVVALGKDRKAYLLDRDALGGIGGAVAVKTVSKSYIVNAAASYATDHGAYVVFRGPGVDCPAGQGPGNLTALRITPGSPPSIAVAWCAELDGRGSPIVTTTDGRANAIVWAVGAEGDERLHGYDGDTGAVVYAGGGAGDEMGNVRRFETPIVTKGRMFVAGDDRLYAFTP
jgi:hypothetical protein